MVADYAHLACCWLAVVGSRKHIMSRFGLPTTVALDATINSMKKLGPISWAVIDHGRGGGV